MSSNIQISIAAASAHRIFGFQCAGRVLIITVLLAFTGNVIAAREFGSGSDRFAGVGFFVRANVDSGGEELVSAKNEDQDVTSLNAGAGTLWEGGIRLNWRLLDRPAWETELGIGIKNTERTTGNGSLSFQRIVLSSTQFYRFKSGIRIGGGIAAHLSPTVEVSAATFQSESQALDTAIGLSVMADYGIVRWASLGLRATSLSYGKDGSSIDASSVGAYITFRYR